MIVALIFAVLSILIGILEACSSAASRWGREPDHQGRERGEYISADEGEQNSLICGCASILCMVVAIGAIFWTFGFGWFLLAAAALFAATRALTVVVIILCRGKDTAPLPRCFDLAMYGALSSSMLILPSLIIGGLVAIF